MNVMDLLSVFHVATKDVWEKNACWYIDKLQSVKDGKGASAHGHIAWENFMEGFELKLLQQLRNDNHFHQQI